MESFISTDKSKLDLQRVHAYISSKSYWGMERTMEQTETTVENSLCFGLYGASKAQIGFGRVVTDYTFFGYIMDVIIFDEYRGQGYGKKLIEAILNNAVIKELNTVGLKTKDAHALYEKYGFKKIGDSSLWMAIDRQVLS